MYTPTQNHGMYVHIAQAQHTTIRTQTTTNCLMLFYLYHTSLHSDNQLAYYVHTIDRCRYVFVQLITNSPWTYIHIYNNDIPVLPAGLPGQFWSHPCPPAPVWGHAQGHPPWWSQTTAATIQVSTTNIVEGRGQTFDNSTHMQRKTSHERIVNEVARG